MRMVNTLEDMAANQGVPVLNETSNRPTRKIRSTGTRIGMAVYPVTAVFAFIWALGHRHLASADSVVTFLSVLAGMMLFNAFRLAFWYVQMRPHELRQVTFPGYFKTLVVDSSEVVAVVAQPSTGLLRRWEVVLVTDRGTVSLNALDTFVRREAENQVDQISTWLQDRSALTRSQAEPGPATSTT